MIISTIWNIITLSEYITIYFTTVGNFFKYVN